VSADPGTLHALDPIDAAAKTYDVPRTTIERDMTGTGLTADRAGLLRETDEHRIHRIASTTEEAPETIAGLAQLSGLLGGDVEFRRITYDGSHYVFTVTHPDSGEPARTRRIPSDDMLTLANLQAAVYEATDGLPIEAPRRNSDKWKTAISTIRAVRQIVQPDEDPADKWSYYIERYITDRLGGSVEEACKDRAPFTENGRLHLHRVALEAYVRDVMRQHAIKKTDVQDALRDLLGFEPVQVFFYDPHGKRRHVHYWRSPEGWDR
jgi:hypothetical protein